MDNKNLVICDPEKDYAVRIATFLSEKREYRFRVRICSSYEQILKMAEETIDLYLVDESLIQGKKEPEKGALILLSNETEIVDSKVRRVNKYQAVSQLYMEILDALSNESQKNYKFRGTNEKKIMGIYSPVKRTGQTGFALKKGKELSKKANVLYINMESYAGYGSGYFKEEEQNMSVLLYYAKQREEFPSSLLASLVRKLDTLDYIPPVYFPEDLKSVTFSEWKWLIDRILRYSIYDVLILDIGDGIQNLFELFKLCDILYLPIVEDKIGKAKIRQFEDVMKKMGYAKEWERMIMCDIRGADSKKDSGKTGSVERYRR